MSCTPDVITSADLEAFRTAVYSKCSWGMSYQDREEVVSDILLAAVRASKATGIPWIKLAFTELKRGRHFTRPAQRTTRHRAELADADPGTKDPRRARTVEVAASVSHEVSLELENLVDLLPIPEKRVFVLCTRWGYTFSEVAVALGIPVSTAHYRLMRAHEQLRGGWLMAQAI